MTPRFVLGLALLLVSCTRGPSASVSPKPSLAPPKPSVTPPSPGASRPCHEPVPPGAARTVRDVDWCNRAYPELGSIPALVLSGGAFEEHVYACDNGEHTTTLRSLVEVAYGDLDGDGHEDAALVIDDDWYGCDDRGTTRVTLLAAFAFTDGVVRLLGTATVNQEPDATVKIELGALVRAVGTCHERWRLTGTALVLDGARCV